MLTSSALIYAAMLLLSGAFSLAFILIAWRRRYASGAAALIVMMAGAAVWAWTYAVYWLYPEWPAPFFWLDMTYLGVAVTPGAFFIFAAQVTDRARWINRRNIWAFAIIPALTLVILWTDPYHGLFFAGKRLPTSTDIFTGGPWFYIFTVYSYALIVMGYLLVLAGYFRSHGVYRKQLLIILLGSVMAPMVNLLSFLGQMPFPGLDLTPIVFTVLGVFYTIGVLRLSLFDLVPVAKDILIDSMREGMLIIDPLNRLVDLNRAALNDLGLSREKAIGELAADIMAGWPELLAFWQSAPAGGSQAQIAFQAGQTRVVNVNRLAKTDSKLIGWLITWSDVTALVRAERDRKEANQELQTRLAEIQRLQEVLREKAIRDPLTGLLNRHYLAEALERQTAHARRRGYEIWCFMVDIDGFKRVNDRYGHAAGDYVLQQVAKVMSDHSRIEDFVFRMGGEEFLIIMAEISKEKALARAEEIRQRVEAADIAFQGHIHHATVSIGIARLSPDEPDIDRSIQDADRALYLAKAAGKNCVMS